MTEEEKNAVTDDIRKTVIEEYLKSKDFVDKLNAEKGRWGESFRKEKLPELEKELREKIMNEMNPQESEADRRLRAIEEELERSKKELATKALQEQLRKKAAEIGFDVARADRYAVYGDKAEDMLVQDNEYIQSLVSSEVDKTIKTKFVPQQPKAGSGDNKKITIEELKGKSVDEIRQLKSAGLIEGL